MNIEATQPTLAKLRSNAIPLSISAIGSYLPPKIETAADLAQKIRKSEKWVIEKAGVRQRHISDETLPGMAAKAARSVIEKSGIPDLLISASATPHQTLPDNSAFIAEELGLSGIPCFSVHSSCLSFLTALRIGAGFSQSEIYKKILIVSAELATPARNFGEPESAALLGDGAAAVMLEPPERDRGSALLSWRTATFPVGIDLTEVRGGGLRRHPLSALTTPGDYLFTMKGPALYRLAVGAVRDLVADVLRGAGISLDDIDVVVPHQASGLAIAGAGKALGVPEHKVIKVIENQGNCVAASMPLALAAAQARGVLVPGTRVLFVGTGAGVNVGAAILRW